MGWELIDDLDIMSVELSRVPRQLFRPVWFSDEWILHDLTGSHQSILPFSLSTVS